MNEWDTILDYAASALTGLLHRPPHDDTAPVRLVWATLDVRAEVELTGPPRPELRVTAWMSSSGEPLVDARIDGPSPGLVDTVLTTLDERIRTARQGQAGRASTPLSR